MIARMSRTTAGHLLIQLTPQGIAYVHNYVDNPPTAEQLTALLVKIVEENHVSLLLPSDVGIVRPHAYIVARGTFTNELGQVTDPGEWWVYDNQSKHPMVSLLETDSVLLTKGTK